MVQPGYGGALDTPRTNVGDATYLTQRPDFGDISQELSFQSPGKDGNLMQQIRNGRSNGVSIRTPRQQRGAFTDRRNLPPSIGGAEFTPLLKSATMNSVRRTGKENRNAVPNTPGLDRIEEGDMTPLPMMDASMYTGSRERSYMDHTLPQVETSSVASTPMTLPPRRGGGDKGPLQDGNQLSLREQENVIDRIEKENFGLKLKIHFLEEALKKAGPGFSEAALKENTELKVDKVTMQKELREYKKHLTSAEKDLESYRQQMVELHEQAKRKYADETQRAENEKLQQLLQDRDADVGELQRQLDQQQNDQTHVEKLQDDIGDLEADLREKDDLVTRQEDEIEALKDKLEEAEEKVKGSDRRLVEMEQMVQQNEELDEAKDTIEELKNDIRRLEEEVEEMKEKMEDAVSQKTRAENDLEELQEEMSNKSVVTKGLSRQIEERVARLQEELDKSGQEYAALEKELTEVNHENEDLRTAIKELEDERAEVDDEKDSIANRVQELEQDIQTRADEKALLQSRNDVLSNQATSLQEDVTKLAQEVQELEHNLSDERQHALEIEKDLRNQYREEIERLNNEISDLQAEIRERDNLYDNDSEKWATEKQTLESERNRAEERAAGLQRTIDALRQVEGSLSDKESKLQAAITSETERHKSEEAVLTRQVDDLQDALELRQSLLTQLRNELSTVRDELRQTQIDFQNEANKVVALEDEINVLQTRTSDREGSGRRELDTARQECRDLKAQVESLRQAAASRVTITPRKAGISPRKLEESTEEVSRLRREILNVTSQMERTTREKQSLRDQVTKLNEEMSSMRTLLTDSNGEPDGLSELSMVRKDLSSARQKEVDFLQREASHRDLVKSLKRQIADLERKAHDDEMSRLIASPSMHSDSGHQEEIAGLRQQLTTAHQSIFDLKARSRETDRRAAEVTQELQDQLSDLEDQKIVLEEVLEEARQQAEETALQHEMVVRQMKRKLEKLDLERRAAAKTTNHNDRDLRKSQVEIENLEHDVCQQQETIEALAASEATLRRKLDRARSERAAYRMSAEKLQRDIQKAHKTAIPVEEHHKMKADKEALDTIVRAAEGAEEKHKKELRGVVTQIEWMQARWEREAAMRADTAYAKKFLQLQLDVANACNKAQLRELENIRTRLLGNRKPLDLPSGRNNPHHQQHRPTLKSFLVMARFIARMRIGARNWAKQEVIRRKIVAATEEVKKTKRARQFKVVRVREEDEEEEAAV